MILRLNDIVTTVTEQYVVTTWLHGKEMEDDTLKIEREGVVVYEQNKNRVVR